VKPAAAAESVALAGGVFAVAPGLAWLPRTRTLVVADAHLGYEEVVGGALPLWSTAESAVTLRLVAQRTGAREIAFVGDVVHGSAMSEGAARTIAALLATLREIAEVTLIAGNHEGRSRAAAVLGATVESAERDGWLLAHGDRPLPPGRRAIVGHLHPSLRIGAALTAPAFLACESLIVVPALTPYSPGLDVLSQDCASALRAWGVRRREAQIVVAAGDRLYPFGSLAALATLLGTGAAQRGGAAHGRGVPGRSRRLESDR
jgi:metallophosphoesterase superfamily enzyme